MTQEVLCSLCRYRLPRQCQRLPPDVYFDAQCPMCLEVNIIKVNVFCECRNNERHCEHCTIKMYLMVYPNAPLRHLANVVVDDLPNGPEYGLHTELAGIDQHHRDMIYYYSIRGDTLVPDEETLAQMADTSFSIERIREHIEEIDEVGGEIQNLARVAREYSPNEPLVPVPFQQTVGFGRSYDSIMEDVNTHRNLMEHLRTMDETQRRTAIERHLNIVRTGVMSSCIWETCTHISVED